MKPFHCLLLIAAIGCGEDRRIDDPSAFTELGIPDARYHLGWGEEDVPWETMSPRERADVLRQELVVLRSHRRSRAEARMLLAELRELDLGDVEAAAELDRLREDVRALRVARRADDAHEAVGTSFRY